MSAPQGGPQQGGQQPQSGQPPQGGQQRQPVSGTEPKDHAIFGLAVFGIFAASRFLSRFLEGVLAADGSTFYSASDNVLFAASASVLWNNGILLMALGIGGFYYFRSDAFDPPYKPASIATVAGSIGVTLLFLVLALVFEPTGFDISLGDELLGVIALGVGATATTAITIAVLDKVDAKSLQAQ